MHDWGAASIMIIIIIIGDGVTAATGDKRRQQWWPYCRCETALRNYGNIMFGDWLTDWLTSGSDGGGGGGATISCNYFDCIHWTACTYWMYICTAASHGHTNQFIEKHFAPVWLHKMLSEKILTKIRQKNECNSIANVSQCVAAYRIVQHNLCTHIAQTHLSIVWLAAAFDRV